MAKVLPTVSLSASELDTILGITISEYRVYLEGTMAEGMTWGNYGCGPGKWQIDHILPLGGKANDEERVRERLHYTNTQALWQEENAAKGDSEPGDPTR